MYSISLLVAAFVLLQCYGVENLECYKCSSEGSDEKCKHPLDNDVKSVICTSENSKDIESWLHRGSMDQKLAEKFGKATSFDCISFTVTDQNKVNTYKRDCVKNVEKLCDDISRIQGAHGNTIADCVQCNSEKCNDSSGSSNLYYGTLSSLAIFVFARIL